MGVIYFILIFDARPFSGKTYKRSIEIEKYVFSDKSKMEKKEFLSKESKEFFNKVFKYDKNERIDYKGLLQLEFFT